MNSTATLDTVHTAELDDRVSALLLNAEILTADCGLDVHLNHGIRANGGCTCPSGRSCGKDSGKHPRGKKWQHKSTQDLAEITRRLEQHPNSNLGIRTGNGLVVIDVDVRDDGFATLAKLEAEYGSLPRVMVVRTGSGGIQIYVSVRASIANRIGNSQGKLGPGIDIRATGGQVAAPPSIHYSGNRYVWQAFTPGQPPTLSQPWIDLLIEKSPAAPLPKARKRIRTNNSNRQASSRRQGGRQGQQQGQQREGVAGAICSICNCDPRSDVVNRVGNILIRCQVTGSKMTNTAIYRLAGGFKNILELADKTGEELLPLVEFWYRVGVQNMSQKSWERVKKRWLTVAWPWAEPEVGPAWDAAREVITPERLAEAKQSDHAGRFLLRAICNFIQEQAYNGLWYLPCRTAMDVLNAYGVKGNHVTVSYWIKQLVVEGFLVKSKYRDSENPYTIYYQTAEAYARCQQRDREREDQMAAEPTKPVPRNCLTTTERLPLATRPLPGLANAGVDDPTLLRPAEAANHFGGVATATQAVSRLQAVLRN